MYKDRVSVKLRSRTKVRVEIKIRDRGLVIGWVRGRDKVRL